MASSLICLLFSCSVFLLGFNIDAVSSSTVVNRSGVNQAFVNALEDFVDANVEIQEEVEDKLVSLQSSHDDQSETISEMEKRIESLARGELSSCQGMMLHESCIFLGKRQSNHEGSVEICAENNAELASITSQNDANAVHDYIRHGDVMAERATIYVWTNTQAYDSSDVQANIPWAPGYPRGNRGYNHVIWRISFDSFLDADDGFLNVPDTIFGYPLCKTNATRTEKNIDDDEWGNGDEENVCQGSVAHCGLGMSDGRILNSQITASSSSWSTTYARFSEGRYAWRGSGSNAYLQVSFNSSVVISGILMKGAGAAYSYWTTSFKVQYGNFTHAMRYIQDLNGVEIFQGNTVNIKEVSVFFEEPINTKYIRVYPLTWYSDDAIRMELLTPTDLTSAVGRSLPSDAVCVFRKPQQSQSSFCESLKSQCGIGLIDGRIEDSQISSSSYVSSTYHHTKVGLQEVAYGWSRRSGADPWVQINFNVTLPITGLMMRGALTSSMWVTTFKIQFGEEENDLHYIEDNNGVEIFSGNTNEYDIRTIYFDEEIKARYFRFLPISYSGSYPVVRFEILTATNLHGEEVLDLPAGARCTYGRADLYIEE